MQLSADTYMISKTSAAGAFASKGAMQADAIREANKFAATKGKVAVTRGTNWERPAQGFPTFEYQFILVDPNDPRASDVSLTPRPDVVIERRDRISADIKTKDETAKAPDLYAELTKLDDLRKRNIISETEFQAEKKKLLDRSK